MLAERGAAACVLSCRRNKARKGLVQVALPGCGALYMPLGDQSLWVIGYAVSVVLANGVAINDLPQFLGTSSGKDLLANGSVVVMCVDPRGMLLLAMGLAAHGLLSPKPIARPSLGEAEGPRMDTLLVHSSGDQ